MKRNKEHEIDEYMFLDWVNNFISMQAFADFYYISKEEARVILSRAKIAREFEISNINDLPPEHILEYEDWYKKSFQFD